MIGMEEGVNTILEDGRDERSIVTVGPIVPEDGTGMTISIVADGGPEHWSGKPRSGNNFDNTGIGSRHDGWDSIRGGGPDHFGNIGAGGGIGGGAVTGETGVGHGLRIADRVLTTVLG
ncbi:unnamed protein product [Strongylus vulgaris]|uniref:Uncharacterized protein n=1 Tax=Strongylus vulgaris TaxID=40348 RepID=A0A3P7IXT6_STRVU|nr:unnamed protein product [Strongylus vulgaris]